MLNKFTDWFNRKCGWFFTNARKQDERIQQQENDDFESVKSALKYAKAEGLEVEVVVWALKYMKQDSKLTVSEAITMGYFEWVK